MSKDNVKSFRELLVWQKGVELAKAVHSLTRSFPGDEKYGLVSQLRRAAVSVPSNIAEGKALIARINELQKMLHSLRAKLPTPHSPLPTNH